MRGFRWSQSEVETLRRMWAGDKPVRMWEDALPGRGERAIYAMAHRLGLPQRIPHLTRPECLTWRLLQQVMADGEPRTAAQLAAAAGLSLWSVTKQLNLRSESQVHVIGYTTGRHKERIWKLGPGRNAKKPPRKPATVCTQEWRKRALKNKPELFDAQNARRSIRRAEKRGKFIRRDVAASWI